MKLLLVMDELPKAQSADMRRKTPRPQFSLRGLLLFTTMAATVFGAARLIPYDAWTLIGALVCLTVGAIIVYVAPALWLVSDGILRTSLMLLGVFLMLMGIAAAIIGGFWILI